MKNYLIMLLSVFLLSSCGSSRSSGYTPSAQAVNPDLSDNLNLNAIAIMFSESNDLEDFERRINNPERPVSNLDLNGDGHVDYLRVVSAEDQGVHVIVIQAVLERDIFQDVATIDAGRDSQGGYTMQVIGDPFIYGPNYFITPVFARPPIIYGYLWGPGFRPWVSPWYWGYYPSYFYFWNPWDPFYYYDYVYGYYPPNYTYRRRNVRDLSRASQLQRRISRNDYASRNPNQSFTSRNQGVSNRYELLRDRGELGVDRVTRPNLKPGEVYRPSERPGRPQTTRPSTRPTTRPATRPNTQTRPAPTTPTRPPSGRPGGGSPRTRPPL